VIHDLNGPGVSGSHGCAGARQRVDVTGVHRLAAVGATQVDVADLAAGVVAIEDQRSFPAAVISGS
jgi:hypothetical protein